MEPRARYSWARFDDLINGALAYVDATSQLYQMHISSYEEPTEIPTTLVLLPTRIVARW